MTSKRGGLTRLRDASARRSPVDARLARQLRILTGDGRLPVLRPAARGSTHQRRWFLAALRLAAVFAVLLTVGGGATAGIVLLGRHLRRGPSHEAVAAREVDARGVPMSAVLHHPRRSGKSPVSDLDPVLSKPEAPGAVPSPSAEAPVAEALAPEPPAPVPTPAPTARAMPVSQPARRHSSSGDISRRGPDLAGEAELLRRVLLASRNAQDDRATLGLLDAYEARFPQGILSWEAAAMRVEVLLRAGQRGGALAILDRLPLLELGQPAGLMVLRGELRSLEGRCHEAVLDFNLALRTADRMAAAEVARAVYGRASCRARTGDAAGAEEDRQRYLREFPDGPAAAHLRSRSR